MEHLGICPKNNKKIYIQQVNTFFSKLKVKIDV